MKKGKGFVEKQILNFSEFPDLVTDFLIWGNGLRVIAVGVLRMSNILETCLEAVGGRAGPFAG
jgi:hypothetical protein